jgi:IS30 family transposase
MLPTTAPYAEIAAAIGVDPRTVSREVKRNSIDGHYDAARADKRSRNRRSAASSTPKTFTQSVRAAVEAKLLDDWSPEQISNRMREEGKATVSHERIYQHVWADKANGGTLHQHLRQASRLRRKRYGTHSRRGPLPNRRMIDERPRAVDKRSRTGDWEIDTIVGSHHRGAIITAVERRTRYTVLNLVRSPNAADVTRALLRQLGPHRDRVLTITSDNDRAFARHETIARELEADFFFAHPHHPWERGTNENTNGLLRQYFPKSTNFHSTRPRELRCAEHKLNNRPRKVLGWKTPLESLLNITSSFF